MIPYSRQLIDEDDIAAVVEALRGDIITRGAKVQAFEQALCEYTGARYAVAVSSGTAALHLAYLAAGIGPGDEVIIPAITFAATANAVLYCGARPVFCDVSEEDAAMDGAYLGQMTNDPRVVVSVDFAGRPVDYVPFRVACRAQERVYISDACHSLGAEYLDPLNNEWVKVGNGRLTDMTCLSFHPVKSITTGEGGAVLTDNAVYTERLRFFRNHGIGPDGQQHLLGYNYHMTDFTAALGISQLRNLDYFLQRRFEIATRYHEALAELPHVRLPIPDTPGSRSAWHLYVLRCDWDTLGKTRDEVRRQLAERGIGTQVHYRPVYRHPYYQRNGYAYLYLPNAEAHYQECLSIPCYPSMTNEQVKQVIEAVKGVLN